jgi:hypothetical protein
VLATHGEEEKWGGGGEGSVCDGGRPSLYQCGRGGGLAYRRGHVGAGRGGRGCGAVLTRAGALAADIGRAR